MSSANAALASAATVRTESPSLYGLAPLGAGWLGGRVAVEDLIRHGYTVKASRAGTRTAWVFYHGHRVATLFTIQ